MLQGTLRKGTGADGPVLSEATITFALTVGPRGNLSANERQAEDARTKAAEAVTPLSSTPAAVGLLSSGVDNAAYAAANAQTFDNTWGVFLRRLELFDKIVTDIAQVFCTQCSTWSYSESRTDSPICIVGMVCYIRCKQGSCCSIFGLSLIANNVPHRYSWLRKPAITILFVWPE